MAEGMNVRITGKLRSYVETQTGENGLYESVSEYLRALIRQDYERAEAVKWSSLHQELLPGLQASEEEFAEFSPAEIKAAGRQIKSAMRYSLYKKARQQLIDIWLYTADRWGEVQADKYVDGLYEIFQNLEDASWRKVQDQRFPGVYFLRYEKHFVFFRELSTGHIGIISIMHQRMNLPERLYEDMPQ